MAETVGTTDNFGAGLILRPTLAESVYVQGIFHLEHWRDGELIYAEDFRNLWTTEGKNLTLNTILAGSAFTATSRMGLKGTGSAVAGDTQAIHSGWQEQGLANAPTYSGSARPTLAFSTAAAGSKTTSSNASFAITSTGTVFGAFININGSATVDNTSGTLFSAGDFAASRAVNNGDTLTVGYTATLT